MDNNIVPTINTITTNQIAANTITADKIAAGAITNQIATNKESAEILKSILNKIVIPRGYNKSILPFLRASYALSKAIELLEKTPDD